MLVSIVSSILGAIPDLGDLRSYLPTWNDDAFEQFFAERSISARWPMRCVPPSAMPSYLGPPQCGDSSARTSLADFPWRAVRQD